MKKAFYLLISCMFIVLTAGCEREINPQAQESADAVPGYVTFSSVPVTKTTTSIVGGKSKTVWEEGDEITVSYNGADYTYVAQQGGEATTFLPKTGEDAISAAANHTYTLTAAYGNGLDGFNKQVVTGGVNTFPKPITASVTEQYSEDDHITLEFNQEASLLEFVFSPEDMVLNVLHIEGLQSQAIEVEFTDPLDVSAGASVQVVCGEISTSETSGVYLRADLTDNSSIGRVIWLGEAKAVPAGTHVRQPLSTWKTSKGGSGGGISSGKQLKEFQILTSKGCPVTRFTVDGTPEGKVALLADVDISAFAPWSPIGPNGNQDPGVTLLPNNILRNEFDGGGFVVEGLTVTRNNNSWYNYGLFGVAAADIHDLTVAGTITVNSGSTQNLNLCAGGLVSTLRPGCTVQRCTTLVKITVPYYGTEALDESDVYNAYSATVHKWQRVGGIAGRCSGNIIDCINKGDISFTNTTSAKTVVVNCHYGGIAGQVCDYGDSDVLISECTNTGVISSTGKISGYSDKPGGTADISTVYQVFQGMSLGGIVGTFGHMVTADMPAQGGTVTMERCFNKGDIGNNFNGAGGNFGGIVGRTGCDASIVIKDCTNSKSVFGSKSSSESQQNTNNDFFLTFGGVVGVCHARGGELSGLVNEGNVYVSAKNNAVVGGVFGIISAFSGSVTFSDLSNSGGVYTSVEDNTNYCNFGGIVGRLWTQQNSPTITLNAPVNTGYVRNNTGGQRARIGGLIGYTNGYIVINDGVNKGNVTSWTRNGSTNYCYVGGLIGEIGNDFPVELNRCKEYGNVSYNNTNSYHALVVGSHYGSKLTASACHAAGTFGLAGGTVYTIASAADFASMVGAPSTDRSIQEGQINIVCYYDSSCSVGSPWEWSFHEVE